MHVWPSLFLFLSPLERRDYELVLSLVLCASLSGTARKHVQESQSCCLSADGCQKLIWTCRYVSSFIHAPLLPTDRPMLLYTHLYIAFRFPSTVCDRDPFPQSHWRTHTQGDFPIQSHVLYSVTQWAKVVTRSFPLYKLSKCFFLFLACWLSVLEREYWPCFWQGEGFSS